MVDTSTEVKQAETKERGRRRDFEAVVISSGKQDKTVKVQVEYLVKHPRYNKYLRKRTKVQVHDEKNEAKVGDKVEIVECRPVSKTKNWRLVRVLRKAKV